MPKWGAQRTASERPIDELLKRDASAKSFGTARDQTTRVEIVVAVETVEGLMEIPFNCLATQDFNPPLNPARSHSMIHSLSN